MAVKLLRFAALAAALAHLAAFFYVAAVRLSYPFEMEWVEGSSLDHVLRVLSGRALYGPPTLDFIAHNYPPLYFYVSAAVAGLAGPGFLPLRLVSFAASAVCFALIAAMARRAGGWGAAGLAAGLFAAAFTLGGNWLDLARVDALFLALFLGGAYLAQRAVTGRGERVGAYLAAGVLLALSFLTKQTALLMALPLAAYVAWADRRRGWLLGVTFSVVSLAATALFNAASQGWYGYYVFTVALNHPLVAAGSDLWRAGWLGPLALALLGAIAFVLLERRAGRPAGLWLALAAGLLGASYWTRLHVGAAENDSLPAFAALALLGGLGVERAAAMRLWTPLGSAAVLANVLCIVQFAQLTYNPLASVPTAANRAAAQALVQKVAQVGGDVWVPQHGGLTWLAGKAPHAHLIGLEDVLATGGPPAAQLLAETQAALRQRRFAAIILDGPDFAQRFPELEQNYVAAGEVAPGEAFYSLTGPRPLPEVIYVPK